jgi:hypothetical protein
LRSSDGPTAVVEKVPRRWPARAKLAHNISGAYIPVRYQQTECDSARKINQQFKVMQQLKAVA